VHGALLRITFCSVILDEFIQIVTAIVGLPFVLLVLYIAAVKHGKVTKGAVHTWFTLHLFCVHLITATLFTALLITLLITPIIDE
jgi:hypothetical protein